MYDGTGNVTALPWCCRPPVGLAEQLCVEPSGVGRCSLLETAVTVVDVLGSYSCRT